MFWGDAQHGRTSTGLCDAPTPGTIVLQNRKTFFWWRTGAKFFLLLSLNTIYLLYLYSIVKNMSLLLHCWKIWIGQSKFMCFKLPCNCSFCSFNSTTLLFFFSVVMWVFPPVYHGSPLAPTKWKWNKVMLCLFNHIWHIKVGWATAVVCQMWNYSRFSSIMRWAWMICSYFSWKSRWNWSSLITVCVPWKKNRKYIRVYLPQDFFASKKSAILQNGQKTAC